MNKLSNTGMLLRAIFSFVVGVSSVVLAITLLSRNVEQRDAVVTPTPVVTLAPTQTPIPTSAFEGAFMEGCVEGDNKAYCTCIYDYLDARYGTQGIMRIGEETTATNTPDEIWEAAHVCL